MVKRFVFSFALLLTVMMLVFSDWALSVETVSMSTVEQSVDGRLSMAESSPRCCGDRSVRYVDEDEQPVNFCFHGVKSCA
jgi:hypothetical protein